MSTQQPESLRLAEILEGDYCPDWFYEQGVDEVAAEMRRLHAENEALQQVYDAARLEIDHLRGATKMMEPAGEYPPLPDPKFTRVVDGIPCITLLEHRLLMRAYVDADRAMRARAASATDSYVQPVPDKCDRITWRGGYYHLPLETPQPPQPVAWQSRTRPTWGSNTTPWYPWEICTKEQAEAYWKTPLLHGWAYEARALYIAPQAAPVAQGDAEDAARYRWLAAHCRSTAEHWGGRWSIVVEGPAPKSHDSEDDFDAAIDAARKQGANHD